MCVTDVVLTPADSQVNVEVLLLAEHGDDQQAVQVDALHQQPIVVGHHAVLHHHHGTAAPHHSLTHDAEWDGGNTNIGQDDTFVDSTKAKTGLGKLNCRLLLQNKASLY